MPRACKAPSDFVAIELEKDSFSTHFGDCAEIWKACDTENQWPGERVFGARSEQGTGQVRVSAFQQDLNAVHIHADDFFQGIHDIS
jgi:hypothetical protein